MSPLDPRPGMQQLEAVGTDVADERVTPSQGRVRCCQCGKWIPLERAFWYELLDRGLIVVRLAGHRECFSGKTGMTIRAIAHETIYDIFLGDREAFGGSGAEL
jgi:hypothetical protein